MTLNELDDLQLHYEYQFRCWIDNETPADDFLRASRATRERMTDRRDVPAHMECVLRSVFWETCGAKIAGAPLPEPDLDDWVAVGEFLSLRREELCREQTPLLNRLSF